MAWLALYLLVFVAAWIASAGMCAFARRLGLQWGVMDNPAGRKAHAKPIAVTGGWGIFATFLLFMLIAVGIAPLLADRLPEPLDPLGPYLRNIFGVRAQVLAVLTGAAIMFAVGATDDLRPLGPRFKLAAQLIATLPLLMAGITVHGFLPEPLGPLSLLWIVGLSNSFNLLDNMDGLCASVALAICLVLSLAAWLGGELWLPALFLCLAGALAGFLLFNFNPASLFMGDAGSLTVGYLMAVFSILITYYHPGDPTNLPVLMPLAIMGVPLFDTLSVMFIRWRAGRPLMVGDRNHFSHRLLAMGFSVRGAALTIALLAGATGLLALPLRVLRPAQALAHLLGLAMLYGVVVALELVGRRRHGTS